MLPVYICEDEEKIREIQREYLEKQIMIEAYDMEIALCNGSPREILEAVKKAPGRGIYFLDVELKGEDMDGFALGREIRKLDPRGFLVYVTAYGNLAFETFRYHLEALDYIVKESREKMEEGLGKSLLVITQRMRAEQGEHREFFSVKVMDVVKHVPVDEILFFEATPRTHRIALHGMKDGCDGERGADCGAGSERPGDTDEKRREMPVFQECERGAAREDVRFRSGSVLFF